VTYVTSNYNYVRGLYHDLLGRNGRQGEHLYWEALLDSGVKTVAQVVTDIWVSHEHRQRQGRFLFTLFLKPPPAPGGGGGWASLLEGGARESDVFVEFLISDEYRRAHPTAQSFVDGLYDQVLQVQRRGVPGPVSPVGRADLVRAIVTAGSTRRQVASYFLGT